MKERFDTEQIIRILGLEIRAEQADEGSDFDVACRIALEKLRKCKEYEDFEKIFREKMSETACDFLNDKEEFGKWLDRNRWIAKKCDEYARAEEKGLLLRLPIPIGTTVYKFEPLAKGTKAYYIETTVTRYEVFDDSIWFTFANGLGRNIEDFGKFVFLTQTEAEQKLKEMD